MNRKYIKTVGLSCFISLSAVAQQSITGTVIDKQNTPVLGATVISVVDPSQRTITDKNGFFFYKFRNWRIYRDCWYRR